MFKKIAILALLILPISLIVLYHTDYGYQRVRNNLTKIPIVGKYIDTTFVEIVDELDFSKKLKQVSQPDKYVNLFLSGSDLKDLETDIKIFQNSGFIKDEENTWRKAKELVNGRKIKIKYKTHGTSISSTKNSQPNLWGFIKSLIGIDDYSPISSGGVSFKIKYPKSEPYKDYMRSYILKSHKDSFNLSKIALNKIASNIGLIAPYGEVVILKINGSEISPYYKIENYNSKEWFERTHNLTNYTSIKSNDDWDHAGPARHASRTDLFIQDKEVNGSSARHDVALGALDNLFGAIKNNDVNKIKDFIDLEYTAKFMSMLAIVNNLHTITGDQIRYIYDHSNGKFRFLHKLENFTYRVTGSVADFNPNLFKSPAAQNEDSKTYKLFKLLIADPEFRRLRDNELLKLVQRREELSEIAENVFDENLNTLFSSQLPLEPIYADIRNFRKTFDNNLNLAKKYLEYSKVYVTIMGTRKNNILRIINDSYNPIVLDEVYYSEKTSVKYNELIPSNELDENFNMVHLENTLTVSPGDINKLSFKNSITNEIIDKKHVYLNFAVEVGLGKINNALYVLDSNNINYRFDKKNRDIVIENGSYKLKNTLVIPKPYSLVIKPGVRLELDENISILVKGGLLSEGTKSLPIVIVGKDKTKPFGVFAVLGPSANINHVAISHMEISGGRSALIDGVSFSGQMSIHNSSVVIKNINVSGSSSDDGINIKNSVVEISNSNFFDNSADQIDLDFCTGKVFDNFFSVQEKEVLDPVITTDGLDISGGKVRIVGNTFRNFSDKAISVGENSVIFLDKNNISKSNIGVAVKDGSVAFVGFNYFDENENNVSLYIKKKFYRKPKVYYSDVNNEDPYMHYKNLMSNFNIYKTVPYE